MNTQLDNYSVDKYTSTEKKFLIFNILSALWFHTPIWVLFFLSKGYTLVDVAFVNMFFWGSIVVFEVPTGYIADVFGRKISIIFSYFIQSIGIMLFVITINFWLLILSSIIWGFGITMSSGAETAWLYDEIQYSEVVLQGKTKEQANERFEIIIGRFSSIALITMALSQIIGGFLAEIYIFLPHTLVACIFFVVALLLFFIPEHRYSFLTNSDESNDESNDNQKPSVLISIREFLKPVVLVLGIMMIIMGSTLDIRYLMQEDLAKGLSYGEIGIFFALIMIAMSFGNASSRFVSTRILKHHAYLIIFSIIGFSFILMSFSPFFLLITIFLLINFVYGIISPLLKSNINKLISTENRATILSLISLFTKLVFIVFQISISYVIITNGFRYAYILTGLLILAILIPCSFYLLKKNRNEIK